MNELWSFVGGLIGAITFVLAIANRVGDRFMRSELAIQQLKGKFEVQEQINKNVQEDLKYALNSSKELVSHARMKVEERIDKLDNSTKVVLDRLCEDMVDIMGYLAKNTEFDARGRNGKY